MSLLDVFPELRRKKDGCEEQRLPIAVPHFDTSIDHHFLQVYQSDYDALGSKLHLLKDLPHE